MKEKPHQTVILTSLPPGLLNGLPNEDQKAISEIVGKPVVLVGYDADGRAELEFTGGDGGLHYIYVSPSFIRPVP